MALAIAFTGTSPTRESASLRALSTNLSRSRQRRPDSDGRHSRPRVASEVPSRAVNSSLTMAFSSDSLMRSSAHASSSWDAGPPATVIPMAQIERPHLLHLIECLEQLGKSGEVDGVRVHERPVCTLAVQDRSKDGSAVVTNLLLHREKLREATLCVIATTLRGEPSIENVASMSNESSVGGTESRRDTLSTHELLHVGTRTAQQATRDTDRGASGSIEGEAYPTDEFRVDGVENAFRHRRLRVHAVPPKHTTDDIGGVVARHTQRKRRTHVPHVHQMSGSNGACRSGSCRGENNRIFVDFATNRHHPRPERKRYVFFNQEQVSRDGNERRWFWTLATNH
eukprot:PhM_4_TR16079/c7_g4_i12/m.94263